MRNSVKGFVGEHPFMSALMALGLSAGSIAQAKDSNKLSWEAMTGGKGSSLVSEPTDTSQASLLRDQLAILHEAKSRTAECGENVEVPNGEGPSITMEAAKQVCIKPRREENDHNNNNRVAPVTPTPVTPTPVTPTPVTPAPVTPDFDKDL